MKGQEGEPLVPHEGDAECGGGEDTAGEVGVNAFAVHAKDGDDVESSGGTIEHIVQAKRDTAVPFEKQQELRKSLGEPEAVVLPTGHVTSAAYIYYLRKRVLRFFDRVLAEPAGSVAAISPASCLGSQSPPVMSGKQ